MDKEQKKWEELFKLISENPELPVEPMVDYEVVAGDSGRWLGSWGNAYIAEYLVGKEEVYFRDDEDMYEAEKVIRDFLGKSALAEMNDEEVKKVYSSFPWIKAIIVNIDSL